MSLRKLTLALALMSCFVPSLVARAQSGEQSPEAPLTNGAVIKLVRAGFREKTVITIINARPARFDLTPDRLIELKKNGVSEKIILVMLARDGATVWASDSWDDDPFFGGPRGGPSAQQGKTGEPGGQDIFGSSNGSRGRTRSRDGASSATDGDTQTSGNATVRILRPPAETGGAATPKLERTPTLTNEAIIELVEAGFSEGTIVRRIEHSPVDFDLTPQKLSELRRRRVSEPVIIAMRAAMSDDDAPAKPQK